MDYVISGKRKYLDKVKKTELSGEEAPAVDSKKKPREIKLTFTQLVLADAMADWFNYKRECRDKEECPDTTELVDFICKAMVKNGKGINEYLVKEIAYGILYHDGDFRDRVLNKIKKNIFP